MKKPPKEPKFETLKRSALAYLTRYAASQAMLRTVLKRRVKRWEKAVVPPVESVVLKLAMIEEVVAVCVRAGLVDDARFAGGRTATLVRRGWPARRIRAALTQKGVAGETAAAAVAAAAVDDAAAARRFAERRRLGPWRAPDKRAERRDKDVAALMRAGFSLRDARAAVDGDPDVETDAEADTGAETGR